MHYYFALEKGTKIPSLRMRRRIADFYVERQGAPRWAIYELFEIRDPEEILKGLKGKPVHEVVRGLRESVGVFKEGDTGIAKIVGMDRLEYRLLERGQVAPTTRLLRKLITYYSEEHDFPPDALARVLGIKSAEEMLDGIEGEELPKMIRTLRDFAGLTQKELAEAINVSEATYRVWEWDGAGPPSLANRRALAGYYETAHGFPPVRIRRIFRVEIPAAEVMTRLAEVSSFSDALRLLRTSQGFLPARLAEILGVSRNTYYSWEENRVIPGPGDQEKIAAYFSEKWGFPYRHLLSHLTGLAHAQQPIPPGARDVPMLNITVNDQRFRVPAAGLIGSQPLNFRQLFNLLVREDLLDYEDSQEVESRRVIIEREMETDEGTQPVVKLLGSPVTTDELNRLHVFSKVEDNDQIVISPIVIRRGWKPRQTENVGSLLNPTRVVRHPDEVDIWLLSAEENEDPVPDDTEETGTQPPSDAGLEEEKQEASWALPVRQVWVPQLNRHLYATDEIVDADNRGASLFLDLIASNPGVFREKRVLEIGTGSGVIAIALARAGAIVVSIDILPEALELAQANLVGETSEVQGRITLSQSNVYAQIRKITDKLDFDMVVTNNPIQNKEPLQEQKITYARWAGKGFQFVRDVVEGLPAVLKPLGQNRELYILTFEESARDDAGDYLVPSRLQDLLLPHWTLQHTGLVSAPEGRPPISIQHVFDTRTQVATLEVGGSYLRGGVFGLSGNLIYPMQTIFLPNVLPYRPVSNRENQEPLLQLMVNSLQQLMRQAGGVGGISLSMATDVDPSGRLIPSGAENVPFPESFELADLLEKRLGPDVRVLLSNDIVSAATAEGLSGAGKGLDFFLFATVSTGHTTAAKFPDGKISDLGTWNYKVDLNDNVRGVNAAGVPVTLLAAGNGIADLARQNTGRPGYPEILEMAGGDPNAITGKTVGEAFLKGNPLAAELVHRSTALIGKTLMLALQNLRQEGRLQSIDQWNQPAIPIILSGGFAAGIGPRYAAEVQRTIDDLGGQTLYAKPIRVIPPELDADLRGPAGAAIHFAQQNLAGLREEALAQAMSEETVPEKPVRGTEETGTQPLPDAGLEEFQKRLVLREEIRGAFSKADAYHDVWKPFEQKIWEPFRKKQFITNTYYFFADDKLGLPKYQVPFKEAFLNLALHGNGGWVEIYRLHREGQDSDGIEFVLKDHGPGIENPNVVLEASIQAQNDKAQKGLGFALISMFPDRIIFHSKGVQWEKREFPDRRFRPAGPSDVAQGDGSRWHLIYEKLPYAMSPQQAPWGAWKAPFSGESPTGQEGDKTAGMEEIPLEKAIDLLEEAMPQGPGILVIEAGVVSRRMGLAEFVARVPRSLGDRIVLFGPESAEAREIAVRNGIAVVDSDKLSDLILQLMVLGDEADRVGYLGDPETAAVLSARLPSSMEVTPLDPETALDRLLLYLGFPQGVLETIDAMGMEELFAQARAA